MLVDVDVREREVERVAHREQLPAVLLARRESIVVDGRRADSTTSRASTMRVRPAFDTPRVMTLRGR